MKAGLGSIQESPLRWPEIAAGIRRQRLRRFPSALVYRQVTGGVEIIALMHLHRRPGYWRRRVK